MCRTYYSVATQINCKYMPESIFLFIGVTYMRKLTLFNAKRERQTIFCCNWFHRLHLREIIKKKVDIDVSQKKSIRDFSYPQ